MLQPNSHSVPAISKPGAMHSNCNSVSCAKPSAQSRRCSSNSFQVWTTFSVMCLCMFLCTGGSKAALRVYMDTVSSCDVPVLRNCGNNSHLSLLAQFFWVFNRKAGGCMFSFRWNRLFELCSKTFQLNMRLNIKHNVLCNFGQFRQMT